MRILQIIPTFAVAGAEQMAAYLMTGLSGRHEMAGLSLFPPLGTHIETKLKDAGIPLWHLYKKSGFDYRMFFGVDRVVRDFQPDVVHTHLSVLRYALPSLIFRKVPVIIHTLHNTAEYESDFVGRMIQRVAFRRCVFPVTISSDGTASFKRVYGINSIATIPNGIPVELYQSSALDRNRWRQQEGFLTDDIIFIHIGRLDRQKNPLLLLESFAHLNNPRAHLVILGDGRLKQDVKSYISERGLGGRVRLLGNRSDVAPCLSAADVFVLSSNWEGNPLSVMEAMSAGLPVVSTEVGGIPDLVESGVHGVLVSPGNPHVLAAAMRSLIDDPDKRNRMATAARKRAKELFGLEQMTRRYEALYQQVLTGAFEPRRSRSRAKTEYEHGCVR